MNAFKRLRLGLPVLLAACGLRLVAQTPPAPARPPSALAQAVETRTKEWSALSSGLEAKIVRLLPCDPRVKTLIEEVSKSSDARLQAVSEFWQEVAGRARRRTDAVRQLLNEEDAAAGEWKLDRTDAEQELAGIETQIADLRASMNKLPALAASQRLLDALAQGSKKRSSEATDRETSFSRLDLELRELLVASQAAQGAIDSEVKALTAENAAWAGYYSARAARAQLECLVTGQSASGGADPLDAPARPARPATPRTRPAAGSLSSPATPSPAAGPAASPVSNPAAAAAPKSPAKSATKKVTPEPATTPAATPAGGNAQ